MENIYFDNNATTRLDKEVKEYMDSLYKVPYNPSSVHYHGQKAKAVIEIARKKILKSLNSNDKYDLIFTSSGTEANNQIINSFKRIPIFYSATEHVSILVPAKDTGVAKEIKVDKNGIIDSVKLAELLKNIEGKYLVSIMLANNETGVVQDIKSISQIVKECGGLLHCDAVQAIGKMAVDLEDLGCDLITISSHKAGGPLGAAALIFRKEVKLQSFIKGGGQERGVRAGTENVQAIGGFGLAVEIATSKIDEYINTTKSLRDLIENQLLELNISIEIVGQDVERLPNTSCIMMPNVTNEVQLIGFDLSGISVSAGSACSSGKVSSSHVLKSMGKSKEEADGFIRISLSSDTTVFEAKKFVETWKEIYTRSNDIKTRVA